VVKMTVLCWLPWRLGGNEVRSLEAEEEERSSHKSTCAQLGRRQRRPYDVFSCCHLNHYLLLTADD